MMGGKQAESPDGAAGGDLGPFRFFPCLLSDNPPPSWTPLLSLLLHYPLAHTLTLLTAQPPQVRASAIAQDFPGPTRGQTLTTKACCGSLFLAFTHLPGGALFPLLPLCRLFLAGFPL